MSEITLFSRTMTSRDIAEATGKRHDNVVRDVRAMLDELEIDSSNLRSEYTADNGQTYPEYRLDRDLTLVLVSGYSAKLRLAIVQRMRALEMALIEAHVEEAERLASDHAWWDASMRHKRTEEISRARFDELQAFKRRYGELDVDQREDDHE